MSTVRFTLMGLAVCYRKKDDEFWTVQFPTDPEHRAVFRYVKAGGKESSEIIELHRKTIKITAEKPAEIKNGYADESFEQGVLDLTGKYLHETNGVMKNPAPQQSTEGVTKLEIPAAKLYSAYSRRGRLNYTFPFGDPEKIKLIKANDGKPQQLTMIVGGEIKLDSGGIILEISGESPIHLDDGDRFHIDNDCHCTPATNDFRIYHKLFKDKKDDIKYEAISIKDPTFNGNPYDIEEIRRILDLPNWGDKSIDKMTTSPPPDVCEIIRIGKADELD